MDHKLTTRRDLVNKMGPGGFKNTIALILGGLSCAAYFLFVVVSIPVYIFRLVVKLLAKWFRPDLGEILNGTSSMFVNDLFTNKPPRTTVVVTMYVRGCISLDEMKDLAMKGWIRPVNKITGKLEFVQFQQYPVRWLGFTFYKNAFDTFHINNHVILHTPRNGKFVEENELNEHVEKILNDQFTPKQSPWELHVIPVYKNEKMFPASNPLESSVLLFKVHHSLADGFSIVSAIVEGFCGHPLTNMKLPIPRLPQRTPWEKIQYITGLPLSSFCEMSYVLSNSFRGSPWKVADDKKEWYQFCGKSDIIPVTSIKQIKNKFNVSFTSVLLSAISAGIFNSLMDVKRKTGYENREHASPQSMYCLSALPIPGRTKRLTNRMYVYMYVINCRPTKATLINLNTKINTVCLGQQHFSTFRAPSLRILWSALCPVIKCWRAPKELWFLIWSNTT